MKDFESFLTQNIKVENKKGNLGKDITITLDKESVAVESKIPLSKRYLKYLTKKYLKKQDLKEFLRVISTKKNTYQLKYFNIQNEEAAEWILWGTNKWKHGGVFSKCYLVPSTRTSFHVERGQSVSICFHRFACHSRCLFVSGGRKQIEWSYY